MIPPQCETLVAESTEGEPNDTPESQRQRRKSVLCTHVAKQLSVHSREIGDEREEGLEDSKLNVDALVHAVTHCRYDEGYGGLRDGLEGNEALEGPERDRYDLGILGRAAHEYGAEKVIGLGAIW